MATRIRRKIGIAIAAVLALTALAACQPTQTTPTAPGTTSSVQQTTSTPATEGASDASTPSQSGGEQDLSGQKLVVWEHTPQFEKPLVDVIAGFRERFPGAQVDYQIKTSDQYYNLLATSIQGGEVPDLFWTNGTATSNLGSYVKNGVVLDLTEVADLSLFPESMLGIVTIDGRQWASPTVEVGGRAVFYNKRIFEELKLEVPANFADFEALLPKLKDADLIPIAFSGADPWAILFHFEPILAAMAPQWLSDADAGTAPFNDAQVVEVYERILSWADAGYYGTGFVGLDEAGALLAFSKEQAAMCIEGTWNVQTIQENNPALELGAFQLPTADGKRPFVGTSSCGFSVSATSAHPEAALAFLNYFASLDGQTRWITALDGIPGVPEIRSQNEVINEIAQYDYQAPSFYDILGRRQKEGENPRQVWEEDQTKVMSRGLTPQAFLDSLNALID